jgi:hypothetical protein
VRVRKVDVDSGLALLKACRSCIVVQALQLLLLLLLLVMMRVMVVVLI